MSDKDPAETLYEGKHLRFRTRGPWEYVERTKADLAVVIAAMTEAGEVLFVEQYRPPVLSRVIELPAGLVGDGDGEDRTDILEAARRELLEETGYEAAQIDIVAQGPVSPGLSNETIALVRATGLRRVGDGGGIENENIVVHHVPRTEVEQWLAERTAEGLLVDPKVYSGLWFL